MLDLRYEVVDQMNRSSSKLLELSLSKLTTLDLAVTEIETEDGYSLPELSILLSRNTCVLALNRCDLLSVTVDPVLLVMQIVELEYKPSK